MYKHTYSSKLDVYLENEYV